MRKAIAYLFFLCIAFSVCALSGIDSVQVGAGFEVQHESIFLQKNTNEYAPDTIPNMAGTVFCNIELSAGNQNFLVQPGILVKEQKFRPFFRKLRYSLFTDRFSLSIGKD